MDPNRLKNDNKILENVKIKVEPGTSGTTMPAPTTRLTSFRLPRDLTLGGTIKTEKSVKKVYAPNVNVQRNKKKEDGSTVKNESGQKTGRDRGRGRGSDRGRGRGKAANNLIQSTGVFSEGMSDSGRSARRSSSGWRNGTSDREPKMILEQSKLNLDYKVDKAEEEEKLKLLLRDDFIDNGEEINMDNAPIALPLIEGAQIYKTESKKEPNMKFHNEKVEVEDEEDEVDRKPIILENGEAVIPPKKTKNQIPVTTDRKYHKSLSTVPQVINSQSSGYILITFPDCLPGVESTDDTDPRINKSKDQKVPAGGNSNGPEYCTLNTLKDGFLGKIQIHQSGKAILRLGDNSLVIDVGSRQSFRQDLIAAKVDGSNSELVNLGQVTSTLICSPDWESMLANL